MSYVAQAWERFVCTHGRVSGSLSPVNLTLPSCVSIYWSLSPLSLSLSLCSSRFLSLFLCSSLFFVSCRLSLSVSVLNDDDADHSFSCSPNTHGSDLPDGQSAWAAAQSLSGEHVRIMQETFVLVFLCTPRATWNEVGLYLCWKDRCAWCGVASCVCAVCVCACCYVM